MTERDSTRFAQVMAALAEAFSQEASPQKISVYFEAFKDFDIKDVERAAWELIRCRGTASFPKVAEIREAMHGNPEHRALLALERLEKAMREHGAYQTVVFDDPVIHAVVNGFEGAWPALCQMPQDEWKWARKDFVKLYQAKIEKPPKQIKPLLGICDHENMINGHREHVGKAVVFIGDKEKVKALLNGGEMRDVQKIEMESKSNKGVKVLN